MLFFLGGHLCKRGFCSILLLGLIGISFGTVEKIKSSANEAEAAITKVAFPEGTWTRAGNSWTIQQTGVLPEGGTISSNNTLRREGDDRCIRESTSGTRYIKADGQYYKPAVYQGEIVYVLADN